MGKIQVTRRVFESLTKSTAGFWCKKSGGGWFSGAAIAAACATGYMGWGQCMN